MCAEEIKETEEIEEEIECGNPCNRFSPCSACADYWNRMVNEGFWDDKTMQWTDKAIKEWTK